MEGGDDGGGMTEAGMTEGRNDGRMKRPCPSLQRLRAARAPVLQFLHITMVSVSQKSLLTILGGRNLTDDYY